MQLLLLLSILCLFGQSFSKSLQTPSPIKLHGQRSVNENDRKNRFVDFAKEFSKIETNFSRIEINTKNMTQLDDVIRRINDDGSLDPSEIVHEFIHDPFPIQDFNVSDSGAFLSFHSELRNMTLYGLKGLKIRRMRFNVGTMQSNVIMEIHRLHIKGFYDLNGRVTFYPLSGNGKFWMNVSAVEIYANAELNATKNGTLQLGSIVLDVEAGDIDLNFDNLLGGGKWGKITNSMLNKMSGLIFDNVKHMILEEVEYDMRTQLNQQLNKLPHDLINERSANIFDDILEGAKRALNDAGFDPFHLPSYREGFDHDLFLFILKGKLQIFNGKLYGLSTLIRTGDIIIEYENNAITLEANIGFENLTGDYDWSAKVMGNGPSGSASMSINSISSYIRLRQLLQKNSIPVIEDFRIKKIRHIWVNISGLGDWDFILEVIINLVSNAFRSSLTKAISGPVKHVIQKHLNDFPISFVSN